MPIGTPKATMLAIALLAGAPLGATTVTDATGDFLATYSQAQNGDLDVVSASAVLSGGNFRLTSTQNGAVGTSPNSLFVWGINRGAGTPRLTFGVPSVGAGVNFDAVAVLFPDGTARTVTFPAMGPPTITPLAGAVTVDGNSISGLIPLALLPSTGFDPLDYSFTLWSRQRVTPGVEGTNAEIADFAPNTGGFTASVPEPATWALMLGGFALVGGALRRRPSLSVA